MSTTIDNKVVEMRFDNKQFEANVATSMSTLDKLKQCLNLTGATKGLENVNSAAKSVDMSGLSSSVETVGLKFNAMYTIADQALRNITNSAYNTGKRIISALTIDPIKTGFSEYETKINAIQTIMANTASKGTTMDDVTKVINELNTYADKTIYNFAEMTRNIGTFTAAGVGLEESAAAIQGIANLAAVSGSTSQQASTAMYQLSQAMASGTVKLMDWNSVVNAGMGGQVFQDALKDTARAHGVAVDSIIKEQGSFRESLSKGWLTADILTETLSKMTKSGAAEYLSKLTGVQLDQITAAQKLVAENKDGTASYEELAKQLASTGKISAEEAAEILKMADNAEDAATKVKTFTQLWDTLKESAQSGWAQTWEILIGDFEEAKETLTEISSVIGGVLEASAKARNELLQGWKDAGGRADLVDSLFNIIEAISSIAKPIKEAFKEIIPPVTVEHLKGFTEGLKDLTEKFKISEKTSENLKRTFKGVFSIVDMARKAIIAMAKPIGNLIGSDGISSLADFLLSTLAAIGDFFTSINEKFTGNSIFKLISSIVTLISDVLSSATRDVESFGDIFSYIGGVICNVAKKIWEVVEPVFSWISDNISAKDIFAGLAGGGIFVAAKKFTGLLGKIRELIEGIFDKTGNKEGIGKKISDVLDSLNGALQSFTTGIKISSLVSIAIAIGILSASMRTISELDTANVVKSLLAIGSMLAMLSLTMRSITKSLSTFESGGLIKAGISLILVAKAIDILANAMTKLSELSLGEIVKGLAGIGGCLAGLSVALRIIGKTKVSLKTSVALVALAVSCNILADAMKKFATMSWDEIGRGLTAMGGALAEFVGAIALLNKFGGGKSIFGSVAILIAVQSLDKMADGLKKFAEMSWDEIKRGLSAMGGALAELGIVLGGLGKFAGFSSILASTSIFIVIQGLSDLAEALKSFGGMRWDEIGRGLAGMGGALVEVGGVTGVLGKIAGFSGIFGSGAIFITIQGLRELAEALKSFGGMAWGEIGRGLTAMGGALLEVSAISGALGIIAGFSGILGGTAIWITIQGLDDLANSFKKFGDMAWDEIGRGIVAMGGALLEVGAISGALGYLTNIAGILGGAAIWVAVQGLNDLADAFKKFGEMSWDEVKQGLAAMGGALGELAVGSLANILSGLGASAISKVSSSLGDLADSVKKWTGVVVPEGLGEQLMILASGIEWFTFGGLGANALSNSASAVGIMADSVRKWEGVTVPEGIDSNMRALADGIECFTSSGLGAGTLSIAAPAVGDLADAIKKWAGITVPEDIENGLTRIANGIKAFSFAFMGGWSISAITGPLGDLVDVVKRWSNVVVPENLEDNLDSLANGVKAFSFAFMGGWSIDAIIEPLGNLANAVKKWAGVTIPENIESGLKQIASGITAFSSIGDISNATINVKSISSSIKELSGINYQLISSGLTSIASSMNNFASIDSISASISNFGTSLVNKIILPIRNASSRFVKEGANIVNNLVNGFNSKQQLLMANIVKMVTGVLKVLEGKNKIIYVAGSKLVIEFAKGITANTNRAKIASRNMSIASAKAAKSDAAYYDCYAAGKYLVIGFANGIDENSYKAAAKARAMAAKAAAAAAAELEINSPSRVGYGIGNFFGLGFVKAIGDYARKAYNVSADMAMNARTGLSNAIDKIRNFIDSDMDTQPIISPVIDLSEVRTGVGTINKMLDFNPRMGVLANVNSISSMMNRNNQNGVNSEIVSAIDKLRSDLGNIGTTSYNINGVTYDDGSNISEAVKTIVRAARIERRV